MVNLKSKLKQVQKQRGALLVMNLVIIALCLVLFWGTIHMFRQLNDAFSRPAKTNWMENNVQSENYAYLVVNYHEDMVYGGLLSGTKKECYGVARYFEAASMYKAFLQTGDTEHAAREKEKMDAAYEEMGDWNIAIDRASLATRTEKKSVVKLEIREKRMSISAESEISGINEIVNIDLLGHDLNIGFNARYLSDSLRAISDDFVKLCFTTSTAPGVIVPTEKKEDEYLYLILPVRIIN